jgi:hypothetical protein
LIFTSRDATGDRKITGHPRASDDRTDLPPYPERLIPPPALDRLSTILTPRQFQVLAQLYSEQQKSGHFVDVWSH